MGTSIAATSQVNTCVAIHVKGYEPMDRLKRRWTDRVKGWRAGKCMSCDRRQAVAQSQLAQLAKPSMMRLLPQLHLQPAVLFSDTICRECMCVQKQMRQQMQRRTRSSSLLQSLSPLRTQTRCRL